MAMVMVALIAWGPGQANASAITYEYGGTITSSDPSYGIAPGTRFSGTFTYDPKDLTQSTMIEGDRNYLLGQIPGFPAPATPPVEALTLTIGGRTIVSTTGMLGMNLYEPELGGATSLTGAPNRLTSLNIGNESGTLGNALTVSLSLNNPSRTVYPSLDLPPMINLADFPSATLNVNSPFGGSGVAPFTGTIDSFEAVPAPEPSTVMVIGLGLAAWIARSRFRKAQRTS